MVNYQSIIDKYIAIGSLQHHIYNIHATLVTQKALKIARNLKLEQSQILFIEEAAMLHDIGICKINKKIIGCYGQLPYLMHLVEGRKILEQEGLPIHALIAENHVGVGGLSKIEIVRKGLALPHYDMLANSIEEQIISYADLFFAKSPSKLWIEKSHKQVLQKAKRLGKRQEKLFKEWAMKFEKVKI